MKIKTSREFLGIPRGSVVEVVKEETGGLMGTAIHVKFDCKDEPVLLGIPNSHFDVIEEN